MLMLSESTISALVGWLYTSTRPAATYWLQSDIHAHECYARERFYSCESPFCYIHMFFSTLERKSFHSRESKIGFKKYHDTITPFYSVQIPVMKCDSSEAWLQLRVQKRELRWKTGSASSASMNAQIIPPKCRLYSHCSNSRLSSHWNAIDKYHQMYCIELKETEEITMDWTRDWTESAYVPCCRRAPYLFPLNHIAKLFCSSGGAIARISVSETERKQCTLIVPSMWGLCCPWDRYSPNPMEINSKSGSVRGHLQNPWIWTYS